ncbi:MAG: PaaI family thioesterase, partial [Myxococcota bacterium]|nr:PaaI family thioesterase [Myxococcota bacterium]
DPYTFGADQTCFGCGPHNPSGLRLRFEREDDEVVTRWTPPPGFDGPPRVLHGGLQATIADEVAGWALVGLLGRMGITTSLEIRYVRPVQLGHEIEARAKLASRAESVVTLHVSLRQHGRTAAMARVRYMLVDEEKATAYLGGQLPESWKRLFRPLGDEGHSS